MQTDLDTICAHPTIRYICATLIALLIWLPLPTAWAECPEGQACATRKRLEECIVCKRKVEGHDGKPGLEAIAAQKEKERNEAVAALNVSAGRLEECRMQAKALSLERDDYRDQWREASGGPSWWTVVGVGVGALLVGGVGGLVVGL